ncbi:hypothetical protein FRB99_006988 [Tulasnella sp. 403]|nr:hypothetical protein FRB99_006988 [Tulasnella sp. 403]
MASIVDKFSLAGKVVVVTGGARGLGCEILRAFCQAGASALGILDILQDEGDATIKQLAADYSVKASFYRVDVRDHVAVDEAVAGLVRDFGRIDVLVCSAGIADNIKAEEYPADRFKRVIDINLNGVFYCTQAVGKHMIAANIPGSIIAIASMSGNVSSFARKKRANDISAVLGHIVNHPQPQCAYNASKAKTQQAVIQLCKSLAAEWAPYKIRVNTISPGYMDTILNKTLFSRLVPNTTESTNQFDVKSIWYDRTPMGRMGNVDELNGAALYLASDASSFTTGADILVDGGYTAW